MADGVRGGETCRHPHAGAHGAAEVGDTHKVGGEGLEACHREGCARREIIEYQGGEVGDSTVLDMPFVTFTGLDPGCYSIAMADVGDGKSDGGGTLVVRTVRGIMDRFAIVIAAGEDHLPVNVVNGVSCLLIKITGYPLELDFAALAHTQGTESVVVAIVNRPRVQNSAGGNIHHIDGGTVPAIAPGVGQLVTD